MSGGYCSWSIWVAIGIIRPPWTSWASRATGSSWCSSKGDIECVVDMLWVLMLDWIGRVVASRCNGVRDDLSVHCQGLRRHSEATVRVCSDGRSLLVVPFSVWASWAVCFDNCWCASDLYVDR